MVSMQLLWSFFQIGLFSIGGGYAAMPLIQHQVVELHQWLTMNQFADIMTIAEMTPGPIAINSATFVGMQIAGISGAIVATLGCVLPSCVIVTALAWFYSRWRELPVMQGILKGVRPAVVAMIASAGLSLLLLSYYGQSAWPESWGSVNGISVCLFAAALLALRRWKVKPIGVMLSAGAAGVILYSVF